MEKISGGIRPSSYKTAANQTVAVFLWFNRNHSAIDKRRIRFRYNRERSKFVEQQLMKILQRIFACIYGVLTGATVCFFMLLLNSWGLKSGGWFFGTALSPFAAKILLFITPCWIGCFVAGYLGRRYDIERQSLAGAVAFGLLTVLIMLSWLQLESFMTTVLLLAPTTCIAFGTAGLYFAAPKSFTLDSLRLVNAPIEKVFATIGSIEDFSRAIPQITKYEILSEQRQSLGTKFRETRNMGGKETTNDLAIIDFVKNHLVRFLSIAGGTTWDTVFKVNESGKQTAMSMKMDATPNTVLATFLVPLILEMVSKAIEDDMDSIKGYCEKS